MAIAYGYLHRKARRAGSNGKKSWIVFFSYESTFVRKYESTKVLVLSKVPSYDSTFVLSYFRKYSRKYFRTFVRTTFVVSYKVRAMQASRLASSYLRTYFRKNFRKYLPRFCALSHSLRPLPASTSPGVAGVDGASLSVFDCNIVHLCCLRYLHVLSLHVTGSLRDGITNRHVTICIPALPNDLLEGGGETFRHTLNSIRVQTLPPREVIVGLSESTASEGSNFCHEFREILEGIPLRIITTTSKGSVGAKRNRAAVTARSRYVTFFDADGDVIHPRRIELIQMAFERYSDSVLVLHTFTSEKVVAAEDVASFSVVSPKELCTANKQPIRSNAFNRLIGSDTREWLLPVLPDIHHGYLSVRTDFVSSTPFSEDFDGREDSSFVNTVVEKTSCSSARLAFFYELP
ncbi:uncharacterized protein MICPUCDRAFT_70793 [Micromonas pusilla CCMP1545]|uniref:Predicted protein n=1 Tax=Micromonas pusilla (strain CCMP1545) TaxID=564608 RepID=C1NAC5_MICPC|nr:uncharacterized protein MICPUCDRAFT_70793 [Micromonas pusilla CCMP1545]EEH50920.1 predicted protein [Micromonas pusilla CCMP1545]|eukprot:XP_003064940.1 predicted protein [Micromonas pusilla CCMP1545]